MSKLLLVDASNWFHIDFSTAGAGAAKQFLRRWVDMTDWFKIDEVVIVLDSWPSWRVNIFPSYKSERKEKQEGFWESYNESVDLCRNAGFRIAEQEGLEADDIIADLTRDAVDEGNRAIIAGSDKDLHQCLVKGSVTQLKKISRRFGKPGFDIIAMTAEGLHEQFGVHPWQWIEWQMIVGDTTDEIPGCRGLGKKAAHEVLTQWKTLERFWANPEEFKLGKSDRAKLIAFKGEDADLMRRLVSLGSECALIGS